MKTPRVIALTVLLGLLGIAGPPRLQAQTFETHTFTTNRVVPDGKASGLTDVRALSSSIGTIGSVKVRLKIDGEFNGDLYAYLRHVQAGVTNFCVLLNRPGKTAENPAGYADSGFDVTFQTDAPNGDVHVYRNVVTPTSALTGIWVPDGRTDDPAVVTDLSTVTTSLTNFNGLNAGGEWTLFVADLESGGTNMLSEWGLDIAGSAYPTLVWANPADITYGTTLGGSQLNATATYGAMPVAGTFTYSPDVGAVLSAGTTQTLSVTFTPDDPATYQTVTTNVTINVLPAPLTIAANPQTKVYGAGDPALAYTVTGLQGSDTEATVLDGALTRAVGENAGTYVITQGTLAANANYTVTFTDSALTITPASLAVAANPQTKVYGAAEPALTYAVSGLQFSDTEASVLSGALARATGESVGTYPIAQGTLTANANYTIAFTENTLAITPASLAVTANPQTKVYGAADPDLTYAVSGFVPGDTSALITGALTRDSGENAGTYAITQGSLAAGGNYTIAFTASTLTIGQASTTGAIVSSANPAVPGAPVTFTMTVTPVAPGAGVPDGSVNFRVDGDLAGSGTLSDGVATFTTSALAHGAHTVVAEYAGSANFFGSTNTLASAQVINTLPVAGNDTIERYPTQGVKVRLSTLLANDSDADHDPLTASVASSSANGGTVTVSGDWVFYTPAPGHTTADAFTYTLNDDFGGSAAGTVNIGIKVDNEPGQNLSITDLGNGSFRIVGSGIPGRTYRLQYTDTLEPANWQDLEGASVTADANGIFGFTDSTGSSARLYRSVNP